MNAGIKLQSVLFGFRTNLALHPGRSPLSMAMPRRPIGQPAAPACPEIPNPGEKCGPGKALILLYPAAFSSRAD